MKTKFISHEIIDYYHFVTDIRGEEIDPDLLELYYSRQYKQFGWRLDIYEKTLYILFDEPLYFNLGETVRVGFEEYTIIKKKINLFNECIEYVLA
jgi:hypothetical protein